MERVLKRRATYCENRGRRKRRGKNERVLGVGKGKLKEVVRPSRCIAKERQKL
jgi:hypothetical protein